MLRHHLILSLCSLFFVYTTQAVASEELAQANYTTGQFEQAIRHWQATLDLETHKPYQRIDIMRQLSQAYQALGLSQQTLTILSQAELLADKLPTQSLSKNEALILTKLFLTKSDVSLATRQDVQARFYADKSLEFLAPDTPNVVHAAILNNLGNVLTVEAYYANAVKTYVEAMEFAQLAGNALLSGRILTNMAYAYLKNEQWHKAQKTLSKAKQQIELLSVNYAKAYGLISIGELVLLSLSSKPRSSKINRQHFAYQVLNAAITIAKKIDNPRLISYGYGFLGQLYALEQRYDEALALTRQAIFYAKLDTLSFFSEQNQASEILYRWQWQLGRLFKTLHKNDEAISTYQSAVTSLQPIRQEMTMGYRRTEQTFRERIGPVYFELADLLLQRASKIPNPKHQHKIRDLKEAIETIERFKTAELQDYFQDDCVIQTQTQQTLLDHIAPHTAVIYPILLPDRLVILSRVHGKKGLQQLSVPITASQMTDEVNEFRFELEASDTTLFINYAKRLYQWLIVPLSKTLKAHKIDTLIIVPDGVLRTIPFAALHDGQQYLINQYALATSPGLTLTQPKTGRAHRTKILLNGLTKSVQNYSALTYVRDEIHNISQYYPTQNRTLLLDQDFTVKQFAKALTSDIYSILHIASHGQIDSNPQKTFLLTYDGKITVAQLESMIRLGERRQEPLDLLTLSACQTAVGDDQAALGLAGLALKAGARSALASLWVVDDKATSLLMKKFYQKLQHQGLSKAKALQTAQQYLLGYYRYRHPAYWAPFLLIGHWK
jgi:CHAT domain-containing protein